MQHWSLNATLTTHHTTTNQRIYAPTNNPFNIPRLLRNRLLQLVHLGLKPTLYLLKHLLILRGAHKGHCHAVGSEASRTTDTVQIGVAAGGKVVVDDHVDALHVDSAPEEVGGDEDGRLALLEVDEVTHALRHRHGAGDADAGKAPALHELRQRACAGVTADVDDELVELGGVQHVGQQPVLGALRVRLRETGPR